MLKYFFLIAMMLLVPAISQASDPAMPTYNASTGAVSIPNLKIQGDVTSTIYSVGMQQAQGPNFLVTSATSIGSGLATAETATYNASTGTVSIPYITINGDSSGTTYYVNLKQGQGLNFAITSVTANTNNQQPATVVGISVSPSRAIVESGKSITFTATVTGTPNTAVTWRATGGTITTAGIYTAPTVTVISDFRVIATSSSDTTKSATVLVGVTVPVVVKDKTSCTQSAINTAQRAYENCMKGPYSSAECATACYP